MASTETDSHASGRKQSIYLSDGMGERGRAANAGSVEQPFTRFIQFLEIYLDEVAGDAHVALAQHGWQTQPEGSKATSKVDAAVEAHDTPIDEGPPNVKRIGACPADQGCQVWRRPPRRIPSVEISLWYQARYLIELTKNPGASDLEVCRGLDADGSIDMPGPCKLKKGSTFRGCILESAFFSASGRGCDQQSPNGSTEAGAAGSWLIYSPVTSTLRLLSTRERRLAGARLTMPTHCNGVLQNDVLVPIVAADYLSSPRL